MTTFGNVITAALAVSRCALSSPLDKRNPREARWHSRHPPRKDYSRFSIMSTRKDPRPVDSGKLVTTAHARIVSAGNFYL